MRHMWRARSGFTLVEIVIVAPIIVLLIGAVIAAIIHATNISLVMQARSQLQLDVLMVLDRIEQDIKTSTAINGSSPTSLVLTNLATDRNPLNTERKLIRASDCSAATGGLPASEALTHQTTYSASGSSYIRSVALAGCGSSSNVWQRNTTETLIKDTTSVAVNITYAQHGAAVARNSAKVELTATRQAAGRAISYTGVVSAKSTNIR